MADYLPTLVMSNLSILMVTSVDGIIVGNFVSKEALSGVILIPKRLVDKDRC